MVFSFDNKYSVDALGDVGKVEAAMKNDVLLKDHLK